MKRSVDKVYKFLRSIGRVLRKGVFNTIAIHRKLKVKSTDDVPLKSNRKGRVIADPAMSLIPGLRKKSKRTLWIGFYSDFKYSTISLLS